MFGDLTAAFGFTVVMCLAPSLLMALVVAPVLMWVTRPNRQPTTDNQPPDRKPPSIITAGIAFAQFYFVSLVILVMGAIVFWWGFIAFSGEQAATDFAVQSFPVQEEQLEQIVEPAITPTATP